MGKGDIIFLNFIYDFIKFPFEPIPINWIPHLVGKY